MKFIHIAILGACLSFIGCGMQDKTYEQSVSTVKNAPKPTHVLRLKKDVSVEMLEKHLQKNNVPKNDYMVLGEYKAGEGTRVSIMLKGEALRLCQELFYQGKMLSALEATRQLKPLQPHTSGYQGKKEVLAEFRAPESKEELIKGLRDSHHEALAGLVSKISFGRLAYQENYSQDSSYRTSTELKIQEIKDPGAENYLQAVILKTKDVETFRYALHTYFLLLSERFEERITFAERVFKENASMSQPLGEKIYRVQVGSKEERKELSMMAASVLMSALNQSAISHSRNFLEEFSYALMPKETVEILFEGLRKMGTMDNPIGQRSLQLFLRFMRSPAHIELAERAFKMDPSSEVRSYISFYLKTELSEDLVDAKLEEMKKAVGIYQVYSEALEKLERVEGVENSESYRSLMKHHDLLLKEIHSLSQFHPRLKAVMGPRL